MLQLVVSWRSGGGDWSDAHNAGNARVSGSGVVATATDMNVRKFSALQRAACPWIVDALG